MITYNNLAKLFSFDLQNQSCIEIHFLLKSNPKYQSCWMGKMPHESDRNKEVYWYGLVADGSEAYDYDNFEYFSSAPVFEGKTLKDVCDQIELISIDGCDPVERINSYLSKAQ